MRLLLIAPTCDGDDIGEAWVAFQWARGLSTRHDLTLLTYYKRGKTPPSRQLPGVRVVEWCEPPLVGKAERLNSMLKPGYIPFYVRARRWIKSAQRGGERFDLVHQPTPVAMRYPCPAAGLGIPVVFGPVGGSLDTPPGFEADDETAPWYVGLRSLDRMRLRWDPLLRRTYDSACCVIGIAPYVADLLSSRTIRRFEVMSETGIESLPQLNPRLSGVPEGPVRLLYVGRLVRTKGLRDVLRALAVVARSADVTLDVVGDGFDRAACVSLTSELGLVDRVLFHGRLPRASVNDFYANADIFVFPSYREPGGNVAFEAMSYGLPLIVSDRGGPGHVVDETCGIRVHPINPSQFAAEIAVAIERLVGSLDLRLQLGQGARSRAADIALWDRKMDAINRLYEDILAKCSRT